ncbi:MAG TPA: hypothetical protein VKD72_24885 [Gemmataceae bacterium]|nr:hypothetical protein [Gemmataceae bacterium]
MPPRSITLVIVVFWLAMTAWLLWRDVWPNMAPGEPPPFVITSKDENRSQQTEVIWSAEHTHAGGAADRPREYTIKQTVEYDSKSDTFRLKAALKARSPEPDAARAYHLESVSSTYHVTRAGNMLDLDVNVKLLAGPLNPTGDRAGHFTGEVREGACVLQWETGTGRLLKRGSESLGVSYHGVVLLPLHPLDRIRGLRPGRRWACNLLDPLVSSAPGASRPEVVWVHAEVQPETERMTWNAQVKECRVIEYGDRAGNVRGMTWVEIKEDRVLRMKVRLREEHWVLTRNN